MKLLKSLPTVPSRGTVQATSAVPSGKRERPLNDWERIQQSLREAMSAESYNNWLEPVRLGHFGDDCHLHLVVPSADARDWLQSEFGGPIAAAARSLGINVARVTFGVAEPDPPPVQQAFDFEPRRQMFNKLYTFERFVVGSSNEFAHAAAKAVARAPAEAYNPLYLYADTGLGKTHLLHAIGHRLQSASPSLRIVYVTSEDFLNEMIKSLRTNRMRLFHQRFRMADALLVDDIQMIGSKERTQEEFFHTFNALHNRGKQIVLASDSNPSEITGMVDRLKSRFSWGLMADIQPPDLETKMAILDRKSEERGMRLPEDVRTYIATRLNSNIRELEEFVNSLTARVQFLGGRISLGMVRHLLRSTPRQAATGPTIDSVQRAVAEEFGLSVSALTARNNSREVAYPRQVAMYLCKFLTKSSLTQIGKAFHRHHTTVLHSVSKIERKRTEDSKLEATLNSVKEKFKQHYFSR